MATIAHPVVLPYVLKTASCLITRDGAADTDDFTDHVGEITLTPNVQSGSWTGVGGNVISEQGIATWTAGLGLIQDLDANGLLRYLLIHEGEKATIACALVDSADVVTVTVKLSPATIGGPVGSNPLTGTVTMAVDGKPQWS